jgi:hypothetical protein
MSISRIQYLSVTFLEDVPFGATVVPEGTTISLQKDIARGLDRSVHINGPGSAATSLVAGSAYPLRISGDFVIGNVLNALLAAGWAATSYQWTRNGVPISGATSAAYLITSADGGTSLNCVAVGLSYVAIGGPVSGSGLALAYDGGDSTSTYPGEAITGGAAGSVFVLPPISGGTA